MKGRRFLIYGLTALAAGVARALRPEDNRVVLLYSEPRRDLLDRLDPHVQAQPCSDLVAALRDPDVGLAGCDCLLTLDEDDQVNLKVALTAHSVRAETPVVMRTFDPTMADALEEGVNVRRAYSLSALSAPAFVSAVLSDELLTTLSLGTEQVAICRLRVGEHSPLAGLKPAELEERFDCHVLRSEHERLQSGSRLTLGGLQRSVLSAAAHNQAPPPARSRRRRRSGALRRSRSETMMGGVARGLLSFLVVAVLVFMVALKLSLVDAFYFVVTTATTTGYGDINLQAAPEWLKLFGCLVMVTGGGLVAILFSYLSAVVTADRLEERMGRRAREMHNHVVLAGLGRIGYRVERLLSSLKIPVVVVDRELTSRFVDATRDRTVLLKGDCRLPEDLQRAGIAQARAFVACTDDDLGNLQSTLQARKLNPKVLTVARIVDTQLAEQLAEAFRIDAVVNPVSVAIGSFVGAATDGRALRQFALEGEPYLAFRYHFRAGVTAEQLTEWRQEGVQVLAVEYSDRVAPRWGPEGVPEEADAVITGPEPALRRILSL